MKIMDRISRLFGGGAKADPKRNRLSINLTEVAPKSERQSSPQSESWSPPKHLAFAEKGDITAEKRLIEPSIPAIRHEDIEDLGYLTPSEIRVILGSTETTLRQFAASPRLFAKDVKGDTALHIAARTGNLVQCDLFVRAGSNPAALNNEGQTPADLALIEGHHLVAQLLSSLLGEGRQNKELEGPQVSPETACPGTVLGESGKHTLSASGKPVSNIEDLGTHEGSSTATWSEGRIQHLKALWAEGQSASQIAQELGGVSRNAVLSKLFRLGMLNKPRPGVDSQENQQMLVEADDLSNPPEKPDQPAPRPFTRADEPLSQNSHAKALNQWHAGTFWTGERIEILRRMWSDGRSASEIARAFGGVMTPGAVLFELHRRGIHDRPRGQTEPLENDLPDSLPKPESSPSVELARDSATSGDPMQMTELENQLSFEAEEKPEEFFERTTNQTATGTFIAVLNSSPAVLDDEASDWELDLSPAPIAGDGIGSSAAVPTDHGAESDFLQVRNRGRQSVKRAVVQTGTRISIDPEFCFTWAEEILAKGQCSLDDIDHLVAHCEGNGDLEELRINLQRNVEAAGFDFTQATGHDADFWDAISDTSSDDLADAIEAALTRRTRLPGTQRFVMDKSEELQLLEPMTRAKQELQLGILASETAVETILDVMDRIRDGSRDPGSVSLRTIIPSRPGHAETSQVMAAADTLRSWHTTGRVMDGKRRREALAALEALDLSLAFHKELVRRLEQFPACQAEARQLEAEILSSESATMRLIREHLPYVRRFASRNVEEGEDPEDVFQVAFMGVQRSTRRFDPERGYRFLIYATYGMRHAIMRWRADEGAAIRIPVYRNEQLTELDRTLERMAVQVGGAISDLDLAEELGWTIDEVQHIRCMPREPIYVDSFDEWDHYLPEPPPEEDNENHQMELKSAVSQILSSLTPREDRILRMRFGIGMHSDHTLEEIAERFSVTRQRIQQIEAKALRKLKHPSRSRRLRVFLQSEE